MQDCSKNDIPGSGTIPSALEQKQSQTAALPPRLYTDLYVREIIYMYVIGSTARIYDLEKNINIRAGTHLAQEPWCLGRSCSPEKWLLDRPCAINDRVSEVNSPTNPSN